MKIMRSIAYVLVILTIVALMVSIVLSKYAGAIWYGLFPIVCIVFLDATRTKVVVSGRTLIPDLKASWKPIAVLAAYSVVINAAIAYFLRDLKIQPGFSLSFLLSNTMEELFFRATLIPFLEIIERKLFDSANQARVILVSSVVFSAIHLQQLVASGPLWAKCIAAENMLVAFLVGILLGRVYCRSRNLPSSIILHWGINLESRALQYLAFRFLH